MKRLRTDRPLLDRLAELGDPVRGRLLLALETEELTVSEICQVMQLPQSTASRHLRILAQGAWVTGRRDGQWVYYSLTSTKIVEAMDLLREVMNEQLGSATSLS